MLKLSSPLLLYSSEISIGSACCIALIIKRGNAEETQLTGRQTAWVGLGSSAPGAKAEKEQKEGRRRQDKRNEAEQNSAKTELQGFRGRDRRATFAEVFWVQKEGTGHAK